MEFDKPIFSGTLSILPVGWKQVLKKTWQSKHCALYKASKFGIERLEIFENLDDLLKGAQRIITLENCIKIEQKTTTVFSVVTKTTTHDFMTTEDTIKEWIAMLQSVAFKDFREQTNVANICEDNELYCSSGEGVFSVKLHSTDASERCNLAPKYYTLVLTANALQLKNPVDDRLLYTWPYCFVRRYGHKDGKFTFEAGRKCDSGEGMFLFEHSNQQEIFRCVSSKMKAMKQLLKETLNNSPSLLECGDNQFQAAMSMEAGSRSPLPPSPTTSTSLHDLDHIKSSSCSDKPSSNNSSVTSRTDTLSHIETAIQELERHISQQGKPAMKPKPVLDGKVVPKKPPRKGLNNNEVTPPHSASAGFTNYETIGNYDEIETRRNAWQTHGTDEVKHTETTTITSTTGENGGDEYISWSRKLKQPVFIEQSAVKVVKVITHMATDPTEDESYDRLNFFGSSSKLNLPQSGYKQVVPAPVLPVQSSPSFNDYDEVGNPMEGVRLADDSHLGYAVIRKSPKEPEHKLYNNNPYAIISKPKHV